MYKEREQTAMAKTNATPKSAGEPPSVLPAGVDCDRMNFDVGKYLSQLDEFDMTEAERIELLTVLWDIMSRFVELGWSVDSLSLLEGHQNKE